jgi:hypothetical protein
MDMSGYLRTKMGVSSYLRTNRMSRWQYLATWAVLCYLHSLRPIHGQQRRTVDCCLKDLRQICVLYVKLDLFFKGSNKFKEFKNIFREIFEFNVTEVINTDQIVLYEKYLSGSYKSPCVIKKASFRGVAYTRL